MNAHAEACQPSSAVWDLTAAALAGGFATSKACPSAVCSLRHKCHRYWPCRKCVSTRSARLALEACGKNLLGQIPGWALVRFHCRKRSLEFSIGLVLETRPLQLALSAEVSQPSHSNHSGGTHILTAAPGRLASCSPTRRLPRTYSQALGIIHPACPVLLEASQRQVDC